MQKSHSSLTPKIVGGSTIGILFLIGAYTLVLRPMTSSDENPSLTVSEVQATTSTSAENDTAISISEANSPTASTANVTTAAENSATMPTGEYTAQASYRVPHGSNSITVTLQVTDGVVESVSSKHSYTDQESAFYIGRFDSSIEGSVVGKKLGDISIGRVGGASLTSDAFTQALDNIITDAQS